MWKRLGLSHTQRNKISKATAIEVMLKIQKVLAVSTRLENAN